MRCITIHISTSGRQASGNTAPMIGLEVVLVLRLIARKITAAIPEINIILLLFMDNFYLWGLFGSKDIVATSSQSVIKDFDIGETKIISPERTTEFLAVAPKTFIT